MSAGSPAGRLYTPEMLALATQLANYPRLPTASLHGFARSDTCGGSLHLDCQVESDRIQSIGMLVQACAVGQASAALFARWVSNRRVMDVARCEAEVTLWLSGDGPLPTGPDLSVIEVAREYPARHGAILLPWRAFADASQSADGPSSIPETF